MHLVPRPWISRGQAVAGPGVASPASVAFASALVWPTDPTGQPLPGAIETFYMSPKDLWENRVLWRQGRRELGPAVRRILRLANGAVGDRTRYSVATKAVDKLPPSNDPHDYYSLARYFWPTAKSTDGLPYRRFDGYTNPEVYLYQDPQYFRVVLADVSNCALAYFFTGNETYAQTATDRLYTWFIDPRTAMNPNLEFANFVKGTNVTLDISNITITVGNTTRTYESTGGLLDFSKVYMLVDAIGILRTSNSFTDSHLQAIVSWIERFYAWTQQSARAQIFAQSTNNQGSWFDVQRVSMLLFLNRSIEAGQVLQSITISRIAQQITPTGEQPLELNRTLSWFYSNYNLQALFVLGALSKSTPFDLFGYKDPLGRALPTALNFLIPYALQNGTGWPATNLGNFDASALVEMCKQAYIVYRDSRYLNVTQALQPRPKTWNPSRLWTPYLAYDVPVKSSSAAALSPARHLALAAIAVALALLA